MLYRLSYPSTFAEKKIHHSGQAEINPNNLIIQLFEIDEVLIPLLIAAMKKVKMNFKAVIWDYDGTLIDTSQKNFNVTRKIIEFVTDNPAEYYDCMKALDNYNAANSQAHNWRYLYKNFFHFSEDQIDMIGKLWTQFQLEDNTEITFFPNLINVLKLSVQIPHGIVSQNSRQIILETLKDNDLDTYFQSIIGYEEVDLQRQKPHPEGLIRCIEDLGIQSGKIVYIGDHETDIRTAENAEIEFKKQKKNIEISTIAAYYGNHDDPALWKVKPDYIAHEIKDIITILQKDE
ncbi:MAG: hypothetical protein B1H06_03080 [Candidatus Cloacimonas sp. 4484_143]|nr:MAG: hypothetical protein B1H06_03080 [Candidatus Cloacimonas sp. 4484_143]RLC49587.1 MAG: hypothetical protein DRH79_08845 [Candidatus Cloacimonadota bacterium]